VIVVADERADGSRSDSHLRLQQLAELLTQHGDLAVKQPDALLRLAALSVPSCQRASFVVLGVDEGLHTVSATDEIAAQLDSIQAECGDGPALHATGCAEVLHVPDLETDVRWPNFAGRATSLGVYSVLALRLDETPDGRAALAFYAGRPNAFSDVDIDVARIAAWLVSAALRTARYRKRAANLEIALESNRHIGSAIGILMARELLTADQAFDRLREESQRRHRKLRDLADEVLRTGQLPRMD
jgi:hypothetical protein